MAEYSIHADPQKNRLYIILRGSLTEPAIHSFIEDLKITLLELKPGLTILNDSREFRPANSEIMYLLVQIAKMIAEYQPARVARLVNPLSGMQLSKVSLQAGYPAL